MSEVIARIYNQIWLECCQVLEERSFVCLTWRKVDIRNVKNPEVYPNSRKR